jgi:alkanesulfonate monooxygenase SsuD/methylene tetrahydromethanopterin reductase-like flavin-dependent oxidoreductase (luciferase family)
MKFGFFIINQTPEGSSMKRVYDESLEQIELGEKLGYDAVFLAEHAFFDHGKPSPQVMLGNIAARTKRLRIGTAVSVLPWHHPLDVAQDYATVDLLSEGRLNFGVGRGLFKAEFEGYGVPWEEAQERFEESLEIILKAWTGEPFSHNGKFFQVPEVVVMPKPLQQPHPPMWQPCLSPTTVENALRRGITPILGASLTPMPDLKEKFKQLDLLMKKTGRTDLHRVGHPFIYVGDTNQKAQEEAREAMQWFLDDFAKMFTLPEGEEWPEQYKFYEPWGQYIRSLRYDKAVEEDLVWFGDAESISRRIRWLRDECGVDYVLAFISFGGMEHEKAMKSMELFAEKVMPEFV